MMRYLACFFLLLLFTAPLAANELKPYKGGATPPLVLTDLQGQRHDLREYAGKVVMVQFWATYCAPCVKEMPSVERLKKQLAGKPFAILAVNMGESDAEIAEFLKKIKIDFPILRDPDAKAIEAWKVFVAPSTFVLDKHGKIRHTLQGGAEWDAPTLIRTITAMCDEPMTP